MIGKILLHIGKNPRNARRWLTSLVRSILKTVVGFRGWEGSTSPATFGYSDPHLSLEIELLAFKLTQIC